MRRIMARARTYRHAVKYRRCGSKLNRLLCSPLRDAKSVDMLVNLLTLVFCDDLKLKTTQS